ncbi:MAG TPA: flagellar hook-associated protein FlgK [Bacteroidota bacterium]|nr:flagellar hook-associated protein FlgK [Bacteroidota bacterium]
MSGLSLILEIGRRALQAQQVGIAVTSHNIANATTPGYSRQGAMFVPSNPLVTPSGLLGTGVDVAGITRMRDAFLDQQSRDVNQSMSDASMQNQILTQVQATFNEPSDTALSGLLTKFFNSWQSLAVNPEDNSSRNAVLQSASQLAQTFHTVDSQLTQLRSSLQDDVDAKITKINTLTSQLSALDLQITNSAALGRADNDAMDQRDEKLQELSGLINIQVSYDSRGSMTVSSGGSAIATGAGSVPLQASVQGNQIVVQAGPAGPTISVSGGELGGVLTSYNTTIPDTLAQLDQAAGALIARVNQIHQAGFGLGTPTPTGNAFFAGTGAADIAVDPAILANAGLIAASGDGTPGDNRAALAIAGVQTEKLMNGNSATIGQFYNNLVSALGSSVQSTDNQAQQQQAVLTGLQNQQSSVAGVSLDEEMTNLITYQNGYSAAAKVISAVDSMYQTILNMVTP